MENLPGDGFIYDERTIRLVGKRSGHSFALGDKVRVRIENVSVPRRKIDLALMDHVETAPRVIPSTVGRRGPQKAPRAPGRKPERRQPAGGGDRKKAGRGPRRR